MILQPRCDKDFLIMIQNHEAMKKEDSFDHINIKHFRLAKTPSQNEQI